MPQDVDLTRRIARDLSHGVIIAETRSPNEHFSVILFQRRDVGTLVRLSVKT